MTDHSLTIRTAMPDDSGTPSWTACRSLSLATGAATADPFQHSADAVRLLRLFRYQLLRQGADVASASVRSLLRRLVPNPARTY